MTDERQERIDPDPQRDLLLERFGSVRYYEDVFKSINHCEASEVFRILETTKSNKYEERYEAARQEFLKIYGKHRGKWQATSTATDRYVEVTRIHVEDDDDYIGFMRIQPNGWRGERSVPAYMEMNLHLLIGKVLLTYKKRPRTMTRGCHVHIAPKTTLTIKCISHDQAAVFAIQMKVNKRLQEDASQES